MRLQDAAACIAFLPTQPTCVAFSCTRLAGQLLTYDFRTASVIQTVDLPQAVYSLAACPTRPLLAAGGAEATLFLVDSGATAWCGLQGHAHGVQSVAFTSDGGSLVSASRATMLQWNVSGRVA